MMKFFCVFALVMVLPSVTESLTCRFCNEEYIYSWAGNPVDRPDGKVMTMLKSPDFVSCDDYYYERCTQGKVCFKGGSYYANGFMAEDVSFISIGGGNSSIDLVMNLTLSKCVSDFEVLLVFRKLQN